MCRLQNRFCMKNQAHRAGIYEHKFCWHLASKAAGVVAYRGICREIIVVGGTPQEVCASMATHPPRRTISVEGDLRTNSPQENPRSRDLGAVSLGRCLAHFAKGRRIEVIWPRTVTRMSSPFPRSRAQTNPLLCPTTTMSRLGSSSGWMVSSMGDSPKS